jgi:hypothetical protein
VKNLVGASDDDALRTERRRFPRAACARDDGAGLPTQLINQGFDISITFDEVPVATELAEWCAGHAQLTEGMARR